MQEENVQCEWNEQIPFSEVALLGSCRKPLVLTPNFKFEPFSNLCTDNSTSSVTEGGLELAMRLEEKKKAAGPLLDPAAQELARLAKEQQIADAAAKMVSEVKGAADDSSKEEGPERPGEPFQPRKTLFLPHAIDYAEPFKLRLRIRGDRPKEEMQYQRVKLVREGMSCDKPAADEIQDHMPMLEPKHVNGKEAIWENVQISASGPAGEATVYDVCYCPAEVGKTDCKLPGRFFRLKGKLIAGELTAAPCKAWGQEVVGFKQVPDLNPGSRPIKRCVYDPRMPSANLVEDHCRKVMAFFPPGYDVNYWGSDVSCAKHGHNIARPIKD